MGTASGRFHGHSDISHEKPFISYGKSIEGSSSRQSYMSEHPEDHDSMEREFNPHLEAGISMVPPFSERRMGGVMLHQLKNREADFQNREFETPMHGLRRMDDEIHYDIERRKRELEFEFNLRMRSLSEEEQHLITGNKNMIEEHLLREKAVDEQFMRERQLRQARERDYSLVQDAMLKNERERQAAINRLKRTIQDTGLQDYKSDLGPKRNRLDHASPREETFTSNHGDTFQDPRHQFPPHHPPRLMNPAPGRGGPMGAGTSGPRLPFRGGLRPPFRGGPRPPFRGGPRIPFRGGIREPFPRMTLGRGRGFNPGNMTAPRLQSTKQQKSMKKNLDDPSNMKNENENENVKQKKPKKKKKKKKTTAESSMNEPNDHQEPDPFKSKIYKIKDYIKEIQGSAHGLNLSQSCSPLLRKALTKAKVG